MNKLYVGVIAMLLLSMSFAIAQQAPGLCDPGSTPLYQSDFASLPYVISQPGTYCFSENIVADLLLAGADYAIEIDSDDVVLDLNGYTLEFKVPPETRQGFYEYDPENPQSGGLVANHYPDKVGIFSVSDITNIEIKNGFIEHFGAGAIILGDTSLRYSADNVNIHDITAGMISGLGSVYVYGSNSHIENNFFRSEGSYGYIHANMPFANLISALTVRNSGDALINDNTLVSRTSPALRLLGGEYTEINNNELHTSFSPVFGLYPEAIALHISSSSTMTKVQENEIRSEQTGMQARGSFIDPSSLLIENNGFIHEGSGVSSNDQGVIIGNDLEATIDGNNFHHWDTGVEVDGNQDTVVNAGNNVFCNVNIWYYQNGISTFQPYGGDSLDLNC